MMKRFLLIIFFIIFALVCVLAYPMENKRFKEAMKKRQLSWEEWQKWLKAMNEKTTTMKPEIFNSDDGGDGWDRNFNNIKRHQIGRLELEKDEKKTKYSKEIQDKLLNGEKITQSEEDKFENEYGRFRKKERTSALDLISSVNEANDITELEEGDISMDAPDFDYRTKRSTGFGKEPWERRKRDARRDRVYLWLNRIVPYEIDASLSESTDIIKVALTKIEQATCIRFKPYVNEDNWIKFEKKSGCYSSVGRNFWKTGAQTVSLGTNCVYDGIIMHEVMHALGFWHEQSRPDRDDYVEIFWENIKEDELHNFNKYKDIAADTLKEKYDFASIMHYGKYSFAKDAEKPTLLRLTSPEKDIGQRNSLSPTDILQLRKLYDCPNTGTGWSSWSDFGPCDSACVKEATRFCMDPKDKTSCPNPVDRTMLYWGIDSKKVTCPPAECYAPVNGHWNKWSAFGACSVTCDKGSQQRSRVCTDPAPKNGGANCVGSAASSRTCELRSCSSGPNDCTFDVSVEPMCKWTNDETGDFKWKRHSGTTPSSSTGPSGDHTSGSGYYLFIETSSPAKEGWKARLLSPEMTPVQRCVSFSYNMYGASTGSLHVYVKNKMTHQQREVFNKKGDQLQGWKSETFEISDTNNYQIVIEAVRGSNFQGDIAIDDVIIKDGSCAGGKTTAPPPTVPTVRRVGCYNSKGYINGKRIFTELKNFRDTHINWSKFKESATEIVGLCSAFARDNNYEYFGIEFWGECWTGPSNQINYGRDGESDACWPPPTENQGDKLVGKSYTAMVYKWV